MESKKDIRKRVLQKRENLTHREWEEKSRLIYDKVVSHPFFLQTDTIYCYIDYRCDLLLLSIQYHEFL